MKKAFIYLFVLAATISFATAQSNTTHYKAVDDFVMKLGSLNNFNVATIADTITRHFTDKEDKARAIFYWIANNIAQDAKGIKQADQKNTLPEQIVQSRKSTSLGFSLLVQEMCSLANIRCLSVDGYIKNSTEDINEKADEPNHSWNVVQLGQSPEQWFYVDACKGSGYLDKKMATFTKSFTSDYFFADKTLFNLDHYPDNSAWQLGAGPKSIKEFYALPVLFNAAHEYGLGKPKPLTGYIKTTNTTPVSFSFPFNGSNIAAVELMMGDGRKIKKPEPMNFTTSGGTISFSYLFKTADTFPITIMADGKPLLAYTVEVTEKN